MCVKCDGVGSVDINLWLRCFGAAFEGDIIWIWKKNNPAASTISSAVVHFSRGYTI